MHNISPDHVLWRIAESLPHEARESVIVVGSLAAGFHFFAGSPERQLRTKDADCMIATEKAVVVATNITEHLFADNWQLRTDGDFGKPGTADTPDSELPVVRLFPPAENEWFLELLSCPNDGTITKGREFKRLVTSQGHFALCSFGYFALLEFEPIGTQHGIRLASPEMMALCNLLHHPKISDTRMSEPISGRSIKRSNKDLGRVVALAYLTTERDPDALLDWPEKWRRALLEKFSSEATELMMRAGDVLRALLNSEPDLDEALHTVQVGLLAAMRIELQAFQLTGERLMRDVIDQLERLAFAPIPKA